MSVYQIGPFQLDSEQRLLLHNGGPVALGPKVVETLLALIARPAEVVSKRALMDKIWPEGFVEEANLTQNVHALRKTFKRYGTADPIDTVPRRGYRLTIPVCMSANTEPQTRPDLRPARRRLIAAAAGIAILAAFVALVSSSGFGRRNTDQPALSAQGARLYQIGRYYWNLRTRDGVRRSLAYFSRVIDSDPNDPRGYAAMAEANVTMGDYCYGTHRPSIYYARAQEYAEKALALDPNSVEAHAALGILALDRKETKAAAAELERAIAVDASYAPAQEWYGIALLRRGQSAEGAAHLKTAASLDPLSVSTTAWLASVAYEQRKFNDAITYAQQALELSPNRADALETMGRAYEKAGNVGAALAVFKRLARIQSEYARAHGQKKIRDHAATYA